MSEEKIVADQTADELEKYYAETRERLPDLKKGELLESALRLCDQASVAEFDLLYVKSELDQYKRNADKLIKDALEDSAEMKAAKIIDNKVSTYLKDARIFLRNKELIKKLIKWNIPIEAAVHLRDEDIKFQTPQEIWAKIRDSETRKK